MWFIDDFQFLRSFKHDNTLNEQTQLSFQNVRDFVYNDSIICFQASRIVFRHDT